MKKLELKFGSVKEMLSKDQMKMISGGTFSCGYSAGGTTTYGTYTCSGDPCGCQDLYDNICSGWSSCDDIDCGCKN